MELWLGIFLIAVLGLLYIAYLFSRKLQKKMTDVLREFPNFIVSKQFFSKGGFLAFDMKSRVVVYVASAFAKPILINAEDIVTSGKYEPHLVDENAETQKESRIWQLAVLTKTDEGREFLIPFHSKEDAVKCLLAFYEVTEAKKARKNKVENTKFFSQALKARIGKQDQKKAYLQPGECEQYIDYLLMNTKKILFREHAHGDNNLIAKVMFERFGSKDEKPLRGNFTEGSLRKYVSERKTKLEI